MNVLVLRYAIGALAVLEFLGLLVFVLLYRRSDWRSTDLGRNLMAWAAVLVVVYLLSAAVRFWPSAWLGWTLAAAHGAFAAAVWHRVRVLRRYQSVGIRPRRSGLFSRHASRPDPNINTPEGGDHEQDS